MLAAYADLLGEKNTVRLLKSSAESAAEQGANFAKYVIARRTGLSKTPTLPIVWVAQAKP
jgi:hypothetical protein